MNFLSLNTGEVRLERKKEKRLIRGAANRTAVAFVLMASVMCYLSRFLLYFAEIFNIENLYILMVTDLALVNVFQIVASCLAFVLPYLLLSRLFKQNLNKALAIKKVKDKHLFTTLIFMGLGVCGFANVLLSFAASVLEGFGFRYEAKIHSENPQGIFGFLLCVIATAVIPAIVEEFAMRGVLLSHLRRFGDGFAVFVTALVFGLMHGNLEQIPFAFVLGLYLGFIVVKTESILPAVLLHFLNNFLSVVASYLSDLLKPAYREPVMPLYLLLLFAFGFVGIAMTQKHPKELFFFKNENGVLSNKSKLLTFLLAPGAILMYIIVVFESFYIYI